LPPRTQPKRPPGNPARFTRNRLAAPGDDGVELAPDPQPRQRGIGDQRQALASEIVDDGEDAEASAIAQLVVQKIERPALVRPLRQSQRRTGTQRPLAAAAAADLKPLFGIEPTQFFVVQQETFTLQQDMQASIAEAAANSGDLA
jgi:hypothetical protein